MLIVKVVKAKYIEGYKIEFTFNDGKVKIIDFEHLLFGEVFEPLKDLDNFRKFKLNPFTIEWENGADFAPEFLYSYGESKKDKTTVSQQLT